MLPKENRLKKVRDFNLLMKSGFWIKGDFLDMKILDLNKPGILPKNTDPQEFRKQLKIAFAVGLKISKNATKRNRIRRQISETVNFLLKSGKIKFGYYILFLPKKIILEKEYEETDQAVKIILKKAKLI